MACLAYAQEEMGWLRPEAIEAVAAYLGMAPIAAYEVASFYNMYDLKPVGKYKITVCTNLPCALSGGYHAGEYVQNKLGIGFGETTADGRFTLKEGECMGACGDAPVMIRTIAACVATCIRSRSTSCWRSANNGHAWFDQWCPDGRP